MQNIDSMSQDELLYKAYHHIDIKKLKEYANPFACWQELESPITHKEVLQCLFNNQEELTKTPLYYEGVFGKEERITAEEARKRHIQKIAFFVKNNSEDPITLDVGVPELGSYTSYIVEDGNHRFAAAILRGDIEIKAKIMGSVEHAKELGLWSPNKYEQKLQDIWNKDAEISEEKRMKLEEEKSERILASFMKRTKQFKP